MKQRLALFFDGANHRESLRETNTSMDYKKLLTELQKSYFIVSARYYSGVSDEPEHQSTRDFLGQLTWYGYVLVTKPIKKWSDGTIKGNVDIEIAVDMLQMAPRLDRVILFSGDGDFTYLVDAVQRLGTHVSVCSHKAFTSDELRRQANEFLDVTKITPPFKRPK